MGTVTVLRSEQTSALLRQRLLPAVDLAVEGDRNRIGYRSAINRLLTMWVAWPGRGAWSAEQLTSPEYAEAVLDEIAQMLDDVSYPPVAEISESTRRSYRRRFASTLAAADRGPRASSPRIEDLVAARDAGRISAEEFASQVTAALVS